MCVSPCPNASEVIALPSVAFFHFRFLLLLSFFLPSMCSILGRPAGKQSAMLPEGMGVVRGKEGQRRKDKGAGVPAWIGVLFLLLPCSLICGSFVA